MKSKIFKQYPLLLWVVVIALLLLIAYQVYSGVHLKKVGIPSIFEVEFTQTILTKETSSENKPSIIIKPEISNSQIQTTSDDDSIKLKIIHPESINKKLLILENEKVEYPDRKMDMDSFKDYLKNGNFKMAEFMLDTAIKKQKNLNKFSNAFPSDITEKLNAAKNERVDYPDRKRDLESIEDYLKNGNFEMAEFILDNVIKQQRNLRGMTN